MPDRRLAAAILVVVPAAVRNLGLEAEGAGENGLESLASTRDREGKERTLYPPLYWAGDPL